ncbi:MAG: metalloregulator ArsR/SmtB family transcription factor [Cyanobacteriota bacterium]
MGKEATGYTRRQILTLLKQHGPSDSSDLAQHLDISAMAVRQHLYTLQAEGMVTYEEVARGMGRPAKLWQLTPKADRYFPEAYAELTVNLLQSMVQVFGSDGLEQVLEARTRSQIAEYQAQLPKTGSLTDTVCALAQIRSQEGYMAEMQIDVDGSLLLIENHCPICVAARACTGLCGRELEVFQTVLGSSVQIERTEHILQGERRCVYRMRPLKPLDSTV